MTGTSTRRTTASTASRRPAATGAFSLARLCDDGNDDDTDACTNRCAPAGCGDGVVPANAEGCDDGNGNQQDACTNRCVPARCGDGITRTDLAEGEAGFEACDDGNALDSDECTNACQPRRLR